MPKYLLGTRLEKTISVSRAVSTYAVDFIYPEEVRETHSFEEIATISGRLPMAFYRDPLIGETIEYGGHDWRIYDIRHYPTRRNSRETKKLPLISLEYLGKSHPDVIET